MLGATATMAAAAADLPAGWTWVAPAAAAATALAAAHEPVLRTAQGARRLASLARDSAGLEHDLLRAGADLNASALAGLQNRRLAIEADEPPAWRALDATCHDELVTALGGPDVERTNVTWWQRAMRHVADLAPHRIRKTGG